MSDRAACVTALMKARESHPYSMQLEALLAECLYGFAPDAVDTILSAVLDPQNSVEWTLRLEFKNALRKKGERPRF